ncbi:hypothetical protein AAA799P11_01009, partial [Marine Group I thaumarchaeote SCGC AAA799-P11]
LFFILCPKDTIQMDHAVDSDLQICEILMISRKPLDKRILIILLVIIAVSITIFVQYTFQSNIEIFQTVSDREKLKEKNTIVAYHMLFKKIEYLQPNIETKENRLPENLIIKVGNYTFERQSFELKEEGLYRFSLVGERNEQRIVYQENLDALLSGIAWIYSHGNSDNGKSTEEITKKSTKTKIFATCGGISNWIIEILNEKEVKSRVVSTLTLDKWNNYDNGHTMIEVYDEKLKKWVLYDLDNNRFFIHNNTRLSLLEFVDAVKENRYEFGYLSNDIELDISNFSSKSYDYSFVMEPMHSDEELLKKWYERVIQVPLIKEGEKNYFFDSENKELISKYSHRYQYLDENEFLAKFYPDSHSFNT